MNQIIKFKDWLINVKGYSIKTSEVYCKYAKVLIKNNNDYFLVMKKYSKTTNNTKRVILSSIKKYYEFIVDDRYKEIILPKKEKRVQDYVTYEEYVKIVEFIKKHKKNIMSLIIIRLLYETGIRSIELLNIKINDVYNNRIRIYGKNRLERFIYVCDSLAYLLKELVNKRIAENKEFLFPISYKALYRRIINLSKKINKNISPHMFRRGFATYCITKNIGIFQISLMMGHENINTTKNYIKCSYSEEIMSSIFK